MKIIKPTQRDIEIYWREGVLSLPMYDIYPFSEREAFIDLTQMNREGEFLPVFYWHKGTITEGESSAVVVIASDRDTNLIPTDLNKRGGRFDIQKTVRGLSFMLGHRQKGGIFDLKLKPEYV